MNYRELLIRSYKECKSEQGNDYTKAEFLSDYIFEFETYCGGVDKFLSDIAIDVCEAISNRKTFEYISSEEKHIWYIVMCNMEFFSSKISWGCSIRGAWWDAYHGSPIVIESCGLYNEKLEQILRIEFNEEEWNDFIKCLVEFYRNE